MPAKRRQPSTAGEAPAKRRRLNPTERTKRTRTPVSGASTPNPAPRQRARTAPSTIPSVEPMNPANSPFPQGRLSQASDDARVPYTPTYSRISVESPSPVTTQGFTPVRTQTLPGQTEGSFGVTDQLARVGAGGLAPPPRMTNMPPANAQLVRGLRTFAEQGPAAAMREAADAVREAARTRVDAAYTAGGTALGTSLGGLVGGPAGAAAGGAVGGAVGRAAGRNLEARLSEYISLQRQGRAAARDYLGRRRRSDTVNDRRAGFNPPPYEPAPQPVAMPRQTPSPSPVPMEAFAEPVGSGPGPQAPFVSSLYQGNAAFLDEDAPQGVPVVAKPRRGTVRVSAFTPLVPRVRGVGRFAIDPNSGFPFAGVNKSAVRSMQRAMRTPGPQVVF